jgi:hypothetical protein
MLRETMTRWRWGLTEVDGPPETYCVAFTTPYPLAEKSNLVTSVAGDLDDVVATVGTVDAGCCSCRRATRSQLVSQASSENGVSLPHVEQKLRFDFAPMSFESTGMCATERLRLSRVTDRFRCSQSGAA